MTASFPFINIALPSWEKTLLFFTQSAIFLTFLTPLLFTNHSYFPTLPPQTMYFRFFVELSFGLYLLLILESRTYLPKFSPLLATIGIFIGVLALASLLGIHPAKSFWGTLNRMEGLIAFIHYGLFFLVLGGVFQKIREWIWIFRSVLFVSVPIGIIGLLEYFGFTSFLPQTEWERMEATFGNPALYGAYLLFVIFLGVFLTFWEQKSSWKLCAWSLVLMNGSFLALSGTRAAWLGVASGALFLFAVWFVTFRRKSEVSARKVLFGLVALLGIFFLFISLLYLHVLPPNPFWDRYQNLWIAVGSLETQRSVFLPVALQAWQQSPFFGYGLESFVHAYDTYYQPSFLAATPELEFYDRAHNIFLELLVASGILGLLAYLAMIGAACWTFLKLYRVRRTVLPFVLCALLLAYLLHNLFSFDTTISYSLLFLVFAFTHVWFRETVREERAFPTAEKQTSNRILLAKRASALASILFMVGVVFYTANAGIWQATYALARAWSLQYEDPAGTIESLSLACEAGSRSIQMDACDLSIQIMLRAPFRLYGQTQKQAFLAALEQNIERLHTYGKERAAMFQMKHSILLAQGYEALYLETKNSDYLSREEQILKDAQGHNPSMLPLYKLASTMYAFSGDKQKAEEYFKKAPPEWHQYLTH